MINLPKWFLEELPEAKEPAVLSYQNNQYIAISPVKEEVAFSTIDEAYDYIQETWKLEIKFDNNLPELKDSLTDLHLSGSRTKYGIRILSSHTDQRKLEDFEKNYEEFLKIAEDYKADSADFQKAYIFIDRHPAFWNRPKQEHPWFWMTYGHCNLHDGRLSLEPDFKDGKTYWHIETGAHVEPEYRERYHDYRLDSFGLTVESVFIKVAENISKFYNNDGTQKEDVPHVKPDWILEVEKRLIEAKRLDTE